MTTGPVTLATRQLIARETATSLRETEELPSRMDLLMCALSVARQELSEDELRGYIAITGIDLMDRVQFEMASDWVTWFNSAKVITVVDVWSKGSLIDEENSNLFARSLYDEGMMEYTENVIFTAMQQHMA